MENSLDYYIYIVRCEDNSLYTGITTNYQRRFNEHKSISSLGAKYTRSHTPKKIEVIWHTSLGRSMASKLEYRIKRLSKVQKENLIEFPHEAKNLIADNDLEIVVTKEI
jgi:putative endonuclease